MVYYHCYYILDKASSRNPELFYKDWKKFEKLLDHENSYHRTIGVVMLSNLITADKEKLFDKINAAVKKVADAKGLTIVVEKSNVVYGGQDITDEVIKSYGK